MKPGFTTINPNEIDNEQRVKGNQSDLKLNSPLIRAFVFWDPKGILFNDHHYWNNRNRKKIALNKKERCSFTKTKQCFTSRQLRWKKYKNCTSHCYLIHLIAQMKNSGWSWGIFWGKSLIVLHKRSVLLCITLKGD